MSSPKLIEILGSTPAREQVEVIIGSRATNNSFCLMIQTSPPGGGPPVHVHEREDELFAVLTGQYEFYENGEWVPFNEGEYKFKMRGQEHAFRNSGNTTGRMQILTTPGGLDEYFESISPLYMPQDIARLTDISQMYGIKFSM